MTLAHLLYVTGGTVPGDALSYIIRQADAVLLEALRQGEFCYVLTPRQMGKSSLVVQAARALRAEGVRVAVIDLQNLGLNMTIEQWYIGLLDSLGRELDLQDALDDFVLMHESLSPLQLWRQALRDVVLPNLTEPIVIFIDEIDIVQGLAFSTDEFFGAIRACYNARAESERYRRLTFCLLGVAAPTDLIRNPRLTPFNIGKRIDLHDFTEEEADQLRIGLRPEQHAGTALMQRITYWTGGHPYLTQRVCKEVAEDATILLPSDVDRCCQRLFLASTADNRDDNLVFVQQRLLPETEEARAALLTLYAQVLEGKQVANNETLALVSQLKLSGAVRVQAGNLQVRNRIYRHVFNKTWVKDHLPDAERRRQRAAFRRGALRITVMASVLLLVMGGLTLFAVSQWFYAKAAQRETKQMLYSADMYVLQHEWEAGNNGRAIQLLNAQSPGKGDEDLRGWEWRYLWQQAHGERFALRGHQGIVFGVDYSPDGRLLATAGGDTTIRLWDAQTGATRGVLTGHKKSVLAVKFSPNGRLLASCGDDDTLRLWDVRLQQQIGQTMTGWYCVAFSPDGHTLAAPTRDSHFSVRLWDVATQRPVSELRQTAQVHALAFSPDGNTLAIGSNEVRPDKAHVVCLWEVRALSHSPHVRTLVGHTGGIFGLTFSHDGRLLATGSMDSTAQVWDVKTRRRLHVLRGHKGEVSAVAFSPDDKTLATGSWDQTTRLWEVETGKGLAVLRGQPDMVTSVTFSPDGKRLATASRPEARVWDLPVRPQTWQTRMTLPSIASLALADGEQTLAVRDKLNHLAFWQYPSGQKLSNPLLSTQDGQDPKFEYISVAFSPDGALFAASQDKEVTLWDRRAGQKPTILPGNDFGVVAFSHDSRLLATTNRAKNEVSLWDVQTGRRLSQWHAHKNTVLAMAFSPDGKWLVTGSWDRDLNVWDMTSAQPSPPLVQTLHGHETPIIAATFSPDGKTLVTTGQDKILKFWQVPTFRETISLHAPDAINALTFLRDGNTLLAGGVNGSVYAWQVPSWQEIQQREAQRVTK